MPDTSEGSDVCWLEYGELEAVLVYQSVLVCIEEQKAQDVHWAGPVVISTSGSWKNHLCTECMQVLF